MHLEHLQALFECIESCYRYLRGETHGDSAREDCALASDELLRAGNAFSSRALNICQSDVRPG
jgi:hypothetical protein